MAGTPNRETTDGTHRPKRAYEWLGAKKRHTQHSWLIGGCSAPPEAILESITDGFLVLDKHGRCTYVNGTGAASFGTAPDRLIGENLWEILPKLRRSRFEQECVRAIEQQTAVEFEGYFEPTGRWYTCRCRPLGDELTVFLSDITERKRTREALDQSERIQEALQDSEQRLRLVLEGGHMGRWEWDLRTDAMFWCERVYELLGVGRERPAKGKNLLARIHPQDRKGVETLIQTAIADRSEFQAEFRVLRGKAQPRGEVVWLASRGKVLSDDQGCAVRMLGVLYDVTDRKRMEAELLQLNDRLAGKVRAHTDEMKDTIDRLQDEVARRVLAEGRLRKRSQMLDAFFRHTITPLAFLDRSFRFLQVNEAYARADGKTPDDFAGKNHFALYPDAEMQAIFEKVVETGQPYRAHARPFTYPDGAQRVRYWNWQLTPLLTEAGQVKFLVFSLEDVTDQQMTLQESQQRAQQLQKLTLELSEAEDRERRRLAEILHDDLQQVLAAAKFHLGMLSTRIRGDAALQELTDQVGDLLKEAIGKSRSLSHELSPAVLYQSDLGETFEWLARQLETQHGLIVHVEVRGLIDPRSEPLRVLLYKAAQELLFNVVKHARVTEARLRLQRLRGCVWLTISDRGRGFDPRTLGRTGGFGLLSIRERVQSLGGRVRIRSIPGKGSTFLIAVPDAQVIADPAAAGGSAPASRAVPRQPSASGGRLRVLLVDDHKIVREGLAVLLTAEQDIDVVGQAANGREAIDLAESLRPDVIVMDMAMPVMSGDQAASCIKQHMPRVRIVALSMFEEASMADRMLSAGADAYLLKTSPAGDLLSAIRGGRCRTNRLTES